jgi:3-methylcrotonyl-CoA carboxylase beta subunit
LEIQIQAMQRAGHEPDALELSELKRKIKASYEEQTDIRYAAARLWIDLIVQPQDTRKALLQALAIAIRHDDGRPFRTGVLQV